MNFVVRTVLKPYHLAWLRNHPERSAEWLKMMLADGFHVHHLDDDHANDSPDNLVLIEANDHMRIHGMFKLRDVRGQGSKGGKARLVKMTKAQRVKVARMAANSRWKAHRRRKRIEQAQD